MEERWGVKAKEAADEVVYAVERFSRERFAKANDYVRRAFR